MSIAQPIGVVGLGLLGGALAARFLASQFDVVGYDLDPARREELAALGGTVADSPAAVAKQCRMILLSLPDSDAVDAVVSAMIRELKPGHSIVDTTTGDPRRVERVAERLTDAGVAYCDATVLGSSDQARTGDVIVLAGGPCESSAACAELFACFARQWFHIGAVGSGSRMKLIVNLVLGLNRAALAEGLALARMLDIDPALTMEVLRAGAAYSKVMDVKGEKMLAGDFAPQARLAQHLKDVELILTAAAESGAKTPLSAVHRDLLAQLVAAGFGSEDNAAILRAFE